VRVWRVERRSLKLLNASPSSVSGVGAFLPRDGVRDKKVDVEPPGDTDSDKGEVVLLLGKIGNLDRFSALFHCSLDTTHHCPAAKRFFQDVRFS
jgi:hypothetical protein